MVILQIRCCTTSCIHKLVDTQVLAWHTWTRKKQLLILILILILYSAQNGADALNLIAEITCSF